MADSPEAEAAPDDMDASGSVEPAPSPTGAAGGAAATGKTKKAGTTKGGSGTTKKKVTVTKASGAAGTQAKAKKPARKKKPSAKTNTAATSQAVLQDARAAASDLAQQRARAAARQADPLWYRMEDIVPAILYRETTSELLLHASELGTTAAKSNNNKSSSSSDLTLSMEDYIEILERALGHNGMCRSDVTPSAMACLLEYSRRYATELLRNAHDYMEYTGRTEVSKEDLVMARQDNNPVSISTQLPMINALAQQLNRKPLPSIPANCYSGILLPPPEHQLTARTFDVISGAVTALRTQAKFPSPPPLNAAGGGVGTPTTTGATTTTSPPSSSTNKTSSNNTKSKSQPSYGASRGRQIPVKLKIPDAAPGTVPASSGRESVGGDKSGGATAAAPEGKS